jgi:hypothetical protein
MQNDGNAAACAGVIAVDDPQLGPLQKNQGFTPTMAIPKTSPAWNAGDPNTSLALDQRRETRPQMDGWDIGAYELCFHHLDECIVVSGSSVPAR